MTLRTRTTETALHRECRLAWWFRAIAKVPSRTKSAQRKGTLAHLARDLRLRDDVDVGNRLANAGMDLVPEHAEVREGRVLVEAPWTLPLAQYGVAAELTGIIDLVDLRDERDLQIHDHKTSLDIHRYGKSPHELGTNWQMLTYAVAGVAAWRPEARVVTLTHHYMDTAHAGADLVPLTRSVSTTVVRERVDRHRDALVEEVRAMTMTAACDSAERVMEMWPGDPVATGRCQAFGGCPYRQRCPAFAAHGGERKEGEMPSLNEMLAARAKAAPTATTTTPATAAIPAPAPPPVAVAVAEPDELALAEARWEKEREAREAAHATTTATAETHPAPPPALVEAPARELYLFIGCRPTKGTMAVLDLADLLAPLQRWVADDLHVSHYALGDGGMARGAAAVAALLADNLPPSGMVVICVDPRLPCSGAALEVLLPMATEVVR